MATKKYDKNEVHYSPGHRDSHCGKAWKDDEGYCRHFMSVPSGDRWPSLGRCKLVGGSIRRTYWCEKFRGIT